MENFYSWTVKVFSRWQSRSALVGENITVGVAGDGYSVNEAIAELLKQMDYHRNWVKFADEE